MNRSLSIAASALVASLFVTSIAHADEPELEPEPAPEAAPQSAAPPSADQPAASVAPAPPRTDPPPVNALSLQLAGLPGRALAIQYERQILSRVSLASSIGGRRSGGDAYDVSEGAFGPEGRYWLLGRAPYLRWDRPAMVGPFVGARVEVGLTRVERDDRMIGSNVRLAESIVLGGRVAIARRFELTASIGCGVLHDFDTRGRLGPATEFDPLRVGLTLGVLF